MKKLDDYGHIININSIYGHGVPIVSTDPRTNVYAGTKHAITATTEILRQELNFLKNKKIRVSVGFIFQVNRNEDILLLNDKFC